MANQKDRNAVRMSAAELEEELQRKVGLVEELRRQLRSVKEQNVTLVRKALDLAEVKRELEDKNFELEAVESELRNQNISLVRKSIELADVMRELEDRNYELHLSTRDLERTMAALHTSRERFRTLTESTSDWVWEVDSRGVYTYASPKVEQLLGYTPAEVVGKTPFDFMTESSARSAQTVFFEAVASQKALVQLENINLHKHGREVVLETSGVPIFGDDGELVGYRGIDRDVTARRWAERMVRRQAQALEHAVDGIAITDREGRVISVNSAWARMHGYAPEELVGVPMKLFYSSETMAQEIEPLLRSPAPRAGIEFELEHRRRDGASFPARMSVSVIRDADEKVMGFVAIVHDVSEEQRLRGELVQAQRLEGIGQLAGGIAHDFNNLLWPIIGYAELLLRDRSPEDPLYADLNEIMNAALRGRDLTHQILAFSRKQVLEMQLVDLRDVVAGLLPSLRRMIRENIEIDYSPAAGECVVCADTSQLEQIVVNLAVNAQDAMPNGGRISVRIAAHSSLAGDESRDWVRLQFSDTGCGMDAETLQHIFEPFFTTKAKGQGTGLGLATVYGIVSQHEGSVSVQSEPENGSTFSILLPRAQSSLAEAEHENVSKLSVSSSAHILVVEDDETVSEVVRRILEARGYLVEVERDPRAYLEKLPAGARRPDLLLSDVVMPNMNGTELYGHLTEHFPGLKVLFMSGYPDEVVGSHCALGNVGHFIQKPVRADALVSAIEKVLND